MWYEIVVAVLAWTVTGGLIWWWGYTIGVKAGRSQWWRN